MSTIVKSVSFKADGVPQAGLSCTATARNLNTGADLASSIAVADVGNGIYSVTYTYTTAVPCRAIINAGTDAIDTRYIDVEFTIAELNASASLPSVIAPGANGGLPTTNGTKLSQTADLTSGQSIACSDKTGFSLSATGLDLVTAASTFGAAMIAGIWAAATSAMTTVGSIGKKLADWVVGTITSNQAVNVAQWGGSNIATPAVTGEPVVTLDATQAAYAPAKAGNAMDLVDSLKNKVGASGYDRTTDSLEALGESAAPTVGQIDTQLSSTHGSGQWGASGASGSVNITIQTLEADLTPIPQTSVTIRNSLDTITIGTGTTNANGQLSVAIDPGTYKLRLSKMMYTFTVPETMVVTVDATKSFTGVKVNPSTPIVGSQTLYGTIVDAHGNPVTGATVTAFLKDKNTVVSSALISPISVSVLTNSSGYFEIQLVKTARYSVEVKVSDSIWQYKVITVTSDSTKDWTTY
jgi:hypothetical protein